MTQPFGDRIRAGMDRLGPLCVGIDPHAELLRAWDLDVDAAGARAFGLAVVDAAASRAAIVKPQVSFFERFGSAGVAALEDVLRAARDAGLVTIADAKRGDIGSTMAAYAEAWLAPGSPLEADAVTLSPYLGVGALTGAITTAYEHGKGVFVLATTSNPEAEGLQRSADPAGRTVSQQVIDEVSERNAAHVTPESWGSAGFVVGATVDWSEAGIRAPTPIAPILAPGFGHQGADPARLREIFGAASDAVIVSESRSILSAGPGRIVSEIEEHARAAAVGRAERGSTPRKQDAP